MAARLPVVAQNPCVETMCSLDLNGVSRRERGDGRVGVPPCGCGGGCLFECVGAKGREKGGREASTGRWGGMGDLQADFSPSRFLLTTIIAAAHFRSSADACHVVTKQLRLSVVKCSS